MVASRRSWTSMSCFFPLFPLKEKEIFAPEIFHMPIMHGGEAVTIDYCARIRRSPRE
jgi:hypothetical protein